MDPADAAGGSDEVVYSSDNVEAIEITKPPVLTNANLNNDFTLDSDAMDPSAAFEVFAGKLYSTSTNNVNKNPQYMINSAQPETPLQKLARLQAEVQALEEELSATSSNSTLDQEILKHTKILQDRLTASQATSKIPAQDELTKVIQAQLEGIKLKDDSSKNEPNSNNVVYELYGGTGSKPMDTTSADDRLTKLEQLLGSSTSTDNTSLLHRLEELETQASSWNDTSLESVATKAKLIRADLEAASKARNKIASTYQQQDSQTIQALHSIMTDLSSVHTHLPILCERLQALQHLHQSSASFAARLNELETQSLACTSLLNQLEGTFQQLESSLESNLQTVTQNMATLDERLRSK